MNCPLCHKQLVVAKNYKENVYCPTIVECFSKPAYHYLKSPNEYIFVKPYRLTSYSDKEWIVESLKGDIDQRWHFISTVPKFEVSSEEQLIKKIKTIITFL